jgi:nicotinamidase-related amidase
VSPVKSNKHLDAEPFLDAETRTLVVVDMQAVFADPGSPWAAPEFATIVPAVADLVARFSPNVVFTRFIAPEQPTGAWVDYYDQWPFARQPPDAALWQLVPELAPGDHPVIDRPTFGKWGPELRKATGGGAAGLVLCGVSTDCCVLSTALAAADAGIAVEVIADACAGATPADHHRALQAMSLYAPLITVTPSPPLTPS